MVHNRSVIVGRDGELAAIGAFLEHPSAGALAFIGEAGIGKTALLDEAEKMARTLGHDVARGTGDDLVAEPPTGLLLRALATLGPKGWVTGVERPTGPATIAPIAALDGGSLPAAAVDRLLDILEAVTADGPLLVIVDDLHWADEGTVLALPALLRRTSGLGVSFLVALRPAPRSHALARALASLDRSGATIRTVDPLDTDATDQLAAAVLGRRPDEREHRLVRGAGGNPYLIRAVLDPDPSSVVTAGILSAPGAPAATPDATVPDRIRLLVQRRLEAESPEVARLLTTAAVIGRIIRPAVLARAEGLGPAQLEAFLGTAYDHGWLDDVAGDPPRFRHELIREGLLASTPGPIRKLVHRRLADVLLATDGPPDLVALHLACSLSPPDHDAVQQILTIVAGIPSPAARHVLELVRDALPPGDVDRPRVEVAYCHHVVWSDDPTRGEQLAREALGWITDLDLTYELDASRAYALFQLGRPREAFESWEQARRRAGAGITPFEHAQMSVAKLFAGDLAGATASATIAIEDRSTPGHGVRVARAVRAWIAAVGGDHRTALHETDLALADALANPSDERLPHDVPHLYRAVMLDAVGRPHEALELLRRANTTATDLGSASVGVLRHASTAMLLYRLGRWDEALAEADAGSTLSEEAGVALGIGWLTGVRSLVATHRGDLALAEAVLAEQPTDLHGPTLGMEWMALARATLDEVRGDAAGARGLLALTIVMAEASGMIVSVNFLGIEASRLALAAGDTSAAEGYCRQIGAVAERSTVLTTRVTHDHITALVAGDPVRLAEVAARIAAIPRPWDAGRCWQDAALAAARTGDAATARQHAAAAIDQFEVAGAAGSIARIRAQLRDEGVRIRRAATDPVPLLTGVGGTDWDRLTPTEAAVVARVGEGLSNSQIAERLFVSRRTVESHLGRVYQKLGIRSRAALVAAAAAAAAAAGTAIA